MELKDILPYIRKLEVNYETKYGETRSWIIRPQISSHHDLEGWTVSTHFRKYLTIIGEVVNEPSIVALDQLGYFDEQDMLSQADEKIQEYMNLEGKLTKQIFFVSLEDAVKAAEKEAAKTA